MSHSAIGTLAHAAFWAAFVTFLSPHEPDLGLGRPVTTTNIVETLRVRTCEQEELHCSHLLNTLGLAWQDTALRLAALRKDFARNQPAPPTLEMRGFRPASRRAASDADS